MVTRVTDISDVGECRAAVADCVAEFGAIDVVGNIAGIGHGHREISPLFVAKAEFRRVDLVVQKTTFATHEVSVKIVGLKAIDHRSHFSNGSIGKLQQRCRCRRILVFLKNFVLRRGRVG